jgi:hypothetical protein
MAVSQSRKEKVVMREATRRTILRWIHIVFSIPIAGYIYSPFDALLAYAPAFGLLSSP